MPLSAAQAEIAGSPARFRVAICGRRFGKTYLAQRELARFATEPGRRCWFVAPTRQQAKGLAWEPLKARLTDLRWVVRINESELRIDLVNGSIIELRSADAFDRMRGYSVDFMVLDEFADQDPEVWTVTRPTLADRQGHALFIGTPKGNQNWAREIWDSALTTPGWARFSYTTIDGGRVSAEEVEAARRDMDERTFRQEFLATFEDAGNRVFYAWDRAHNLQAWTGPEPTTLMIGMDFNVDPMSAVVGVRQGEVLHIIDEIVIPTSNTDEMAAEITARYPRIRPDRIWVYPDPASRQRKTSAAGRTDLSILQNAGFQVKAPTSHDAIRDGINAVNSRLCSATGERRLFVDAGCKYTIAALERLSYRPGTSQVDKDSGHDHIADALRYMVNYVWPIRRDTADYQPQRWSTRIE